MAWKHKKTPESTKKQGAPEGERGEPGWMQILKRNPAVDRSACTDCESCISLCPGIFKRNSDTGCIEVAELSDYPENEIEQAMSMCPGNCITWQ